MSKYPNTHAICPVCGGELLYCDFQQQKTANLYNNGDIADDTWQYNDVDDSEHSKVVCNSLGCSFKKSWHIWIKDINPSIEKCRYCGSLEDIVVREVNPLREKVYICRVCKEKMEKTFAKSIELCPFCESEVELDDNLVPQKCSECGEIIMPCGYCEELGHGCDFHWYNAEKTIGGCQFRK